MARSGKDWDAWYEDVVWLLDSGEFFDRIAERLGVTPGTLEKQLDRRGPHGWRDTYRFKTAGQAA